MKHGILSKRQIQRIEESGYSYVGSACVKDEDVLSHVDRATVHIRGYIAVKIGDLFYIPFSSRFGSDCSDCEIFRKIKRVD